MVIGGIMVANFINQQRKNPNSIYAQTMKLATAGADGVAIQKAVVQYQSDNGKYRSEEHTSEIQSLTNLVCRLLLEKKKTHV